MTDVLKIEHCPVCCKPSTFETCVNPYCEEDGIELTCDRCGLVFFVPDRQELTTWTVDKSNNPRL